MEKIGLSINPASLFRFIENSIKGREYSKFIFSRSISDSLKILIKWAKRNGFSREDLSFAEFDFLVENASIINDNSDFNSLREHIFEHKQKFNFNKQVLLPELITDSKNLFTFYCATTKPNFITDSYVSGEVIKLNTNKNPININNKILMIESADPGYDWIFTHEIKGLITKYGGAASHMAIRCSEFNLPAAIGCGEKFDQFLDNDRVIIDCSNNLIKKV